MLEKKLTYLFSSDPTNGALNTTPQGDKFSVSLYAPLSVPPNAHYATVEVQSANIWNVVPNISALNGNNIFKYNDGTSDLTLTIPDGLYDLQSFQNTLNILIDNVPSAIPAVDTFTFTGDNATQKVLITFNSNGLVIDWTASTVRTILGFTTGSTTTAPAGQTIIADNIANFNLISSFLIKADFLHDGIPVNDTSIGVIANVLIDVLPGSLINYTPTNIPSANAHELIGSKLSKLSFTLTDQRNNPIDTNGEYFSFTMVVRYYVPEY